MDLISVIIPVYNVEMYVEECVQSLLEQTYHNIEIILVDDGSTDDSGKICDDLADKDVRVKTLHKLNGGLSDARNYGIKHSNGKYIMFVDSDDIVNEKIVSELYELICKEDNIELAVSGLTHFYDNRSPEYVDKNTNVVMKKEDAIQNFLYQKDIPTSACGKLYLKDILDDIEFVKNQRFEDNLYVFKVLSKCKKISVGSFKYYAYRHRKNSITTSKFDSKEFDIIDIGRDILELSNKMNDKIKIAGIVYQCTNCFRVYVTTSDKYIKDNRYNYCKEFMRNNALVVIKDSNARKSIKLAMILFKVRFPRGMLSYIRNKKNRWS